MKRWTVAALAVICLGWAALAAATLPRNDHVLILDRRAGPYHYRAAFFVKGRSSYADALAAFGAPSRFRADGNLCRVTWGATGITVGLASNLRPCSSGSLYQAAWYGLSLFGKAWRTGKGIRIGQTVAEVKRIYPNAKFERRGRQAWLVLSRRRAGEFNFVRLAVVISRAGRVTRIEVPAAYIY